jgi:hypothetical protein
MKPATKTRLTEHVPSVEEQHPSPPQRVSMLLRWFKSLWGTSKSSDVALPPTQPRQEALERQDAYPSLWRAWTASERPALWVDRLRCAFNMYRAELDPEDEGIDFLCFRSSRGFILYLQNEDLLPEEGGFLMDLLRDKVLAAGYRQAHADRVIYPDYVLEKHYLKPPLNRNFDRPAPQLFGNITIELQYRQQRPVNLKLVTTSYEDRHYAPALPFAELMESLTA